MLDYKHINSASRIHALLTQTQGKQDKAVWSVWADVFEVNGPDDTETVEHVLERLHWLHIELQLLRAQAERTTLSTHLFDSSLARIRSIISPLNLSGSWQGVRGNLTPEVLLALAFLSEVLPDEESVIPEADLQEIVRQVNELSATLKTADLPPALSRLVEHHVELIKAALAQYKIAGARALREAGRTALGEIIERKADFESEKKIEVVSRLGKLWGQVNSAADIALKAEKLGQLGYRAWETVASYLQ